MIDNLISKKHLKVSTKITISVIVFVLIALSIIFSVSYLNIKKIMREDLQSRLLNIVSIAELQIDAEKHSLLKIPADENTQSYYDIKKVLQDIRDKSTDISYIYTLRENENKEITFIVDAEENPEDVSHLGDVYDDANQFLKDNFLTINKPVVESSFTTDKWGTWISGFAPFYDKNGKREGILGIDISALSVTNNENKLLLSYLALIMISGLLAVIFGIFMGKKVMNSVTALISFLKDNNKCELPISNDEVGDLTKIIKIKLDNVDKIQKDSEESIKDKNERVKQMNDLMVGRELEMIKLKKEIEELKKVNK